MLVVETYLKDLPNKGIGLFAKHKIIKGEVVWVFNRQVDIIIKDNNLHPCLKSHLEIYATKRGNNFMLCSDNAKFMNHSDTPNIISMGNQYDNIACRDIEADEEITINYNTIDDQPIDFEIF